MCCERMQYVTSHSYNLAMTDIKRKERKGGALIGAQINNSKNRTISAFIKVIYVAITT